MILVIIMKIMMMIKDYNDDNGDYEEEKGM